MSGWFDRHMYGDDATSDEGVRSLANRIQEYWLKRGYMVDVRLVRAPFEVRARMAPLTIRSDMINGLPRAIVKAKQLTGASL